MFDHGSDGATALFNMDGFVVRAHMLEGGEWSCGVRATGHGRRAVEVRDLPIMGRPVRLVWRKRVWRCPDGVAAGLGGAREHALISLLALNGLRSRKRLVRTSNSSASNGVIAR